MVTEWRIDPYDLPVPIPEDQREPFMLFACIIHGKTSHVQADKLNNIFHKWKERYGYRDSLLSLLRTLDDEVVDSDLHWVKIGQYRRVLKCWRGIANLELPITVPKLLTVPGIGLKTACFIASYVDGKDYPVLDVHVLAWLNANGYMVPSQTPQDWEEYARVADLLVGEANLRKISVAELDTVIWKSRAKKKL